MNAEQINALGGWCELVGVWFVARDLMSLARYREKPKEWAAQVKEWTARVRAWWVATPVMAWWWRLLGRPQQVTFLDVDSVSMGHTASGVTLSTGTGTLTAQPGQSLEDQVEELRLRLNQLQEEISREKQDREQAIAAEREARREGLQAEAERRERQITDVRQEVEGLREATTGDLGLKAEGVVFLVAGIAFTVWPGKFADWLLAWPPFPVAVLFVITWPLARLSWTLWLRPREE
jgi:hypothetical protein